MSIGRRLAERRSVENPNYPLTSKALVELLDGTPVLAGVKVSEESAMRIIAVFRCVELISGTCAALPLKAYRRGSRVPIDSPVLSDPHPEMTRFETWEIGYAHLLLWGNCYFRKLRDGAGRIRHLWPLHPSRIQVDRIDPTAGNPGGKVYVVDGKTKDPYTNFEILHIPGLGYDGTKGLSRIQLAKQGLGLGLAAEEYAARFFGNGSMMSGILTTDKSLDEPAAKRLKEAWKAKIGGGLANAHDIAVLDNAAKFQQVSIPPEDAQLLETQNWSVTQIARLFGLPPHAVGDVEKSTSWGTGIEQQTIGMVQFTLQPSYLTRVEQRLTKEVVQPGNGDVYAEYVVEGILRGDSAARAQFYEAMRRMKAMTANEVRVRENLEPYDGGDVFENPNITPDEGDEGTDDGTDADAA